MVLSNIQALVTASDGKVLVIGVPPSLLRETGVAGPDLGLTVVTGVFPGVEAELGTSEADTVVVVAVLDGPSVLETVVACDIHDRGAILELLNSETLVVSIWLASQTYL